MSARAYVASAAGAIVGALILLPLSADVSRAATCAAEPVTARGEFAANEWLARLKARANWRRRVRTTPSLGPAYESWPAAVDATERCIKEPGGVYCVFTGRPCSR